MIILNCSPDRAFEYYNKALELEEQGNYEDAILLHNKAIRIISNFTPSLINRGADKAELGDFQGAIIDYKKVISYDTTNTLAIFNLGINYRRLNEYDTALKYCELALKTKGAIDLNSYNNPEYPRDFEFVFDAFDEKNYQVTKAEILFEKGFIYFKMKNYSMTIDYMKKASEKHSQKIDCHYFIGKSYIELDSIDKACLYLNKIDDRIDKEVKDLKQKYCN